jgi:hypothetical protein
VVSILSDKKGEKDQLRERKTSRLTTIKARRSVSRLHEIYYPHRTLVQLPRLVLFASEEVDVLDERGSGDGALERDPVRVLVGCEGGRETKRGVAEGQKGELRHDGAEWGGEERRTRGVVRTEEETDRARESGVGDVVGEVLRKTRR